MEGYGYNSAMPPRVTKTKILNQARKVAQMHLLALRSTDAVQSDSAMRIVVLGILCWEAIADIGPLSQNEADAASWAQWEALAFSEKVCFGGAEPIALRELARKLLGVDSLCLDDALEVDECVRPAPHLREKL